MGNYKFLFDADKTVVVVKYGNRETQIDFEGKNHKSEAMDFVARHLMVQMDEIGY